MKKALILAVSLLFLVLGFYSLFGEKGMLDVFAGENERAANTIITLAEGLLE